MMKQDSQVILRASTVPISDAFAANRMNGYCGRCKPRDRAMEIATAEYIENGSLFMSSWGNDQTQSRSKA